MIELAEKRQYERLQKEAPYRTTVDHATPLSKAVRRFAVSVCFAVSVVSRMRLASSGFMAQDCSAMRGGSKQSPTREGRAKAASAAGRVSRSTLDAARGQAIPCARLTKYLARLQDRPDTDLASVSASYPGMIRRSGAS